MHWSPYYTLQIGLKIRWLAGLLGSLGKSPILGHLGGLLFERSTVISTAVFGRVFHAFFLLCVFKGYEALDGHIYELYKVISLGRGFYRNRANFHVLRNHFGTTSNTSSGGTFLVFAGKFFRGRQGCPAARVR
jgi:hypothetical protein